jgi:peptide/nickel transport system permease protein
MTTVAQPTTATPTPNRIGWRIFVANRLALTGVILLIAVAIFCFIGPLLYHTDQVHASLANAFEPPSRQHLLGTDELGRDVLGRLMVGGQISLVVGVLASVLATSVGAVYGAISGYLGGLVDAVMMRAVDAIVAIPTVFLLLFLASIFTPNVLMLVLVIGAVSWLVPARLVRGEALTLRTLDFVRAVPMMGGGTVRAIRRHILPNTIGTVVVNATFQVADAILLVATMSYLGLGPKPPAANWGGMLSTGLEFAVSGYWWLVYPAGLAIMLAVLSFNFIGDGLRDTFNARLR